MNYLTALTVLIDTAVSDIPSPFLQLANYGVLGLLVLALGYVVYHQNREIRKLYEDRLKEQADHAERYRVLAETTNKTLDSALRVVQKNIGG